MTIHCYASRGNYRDHMIPIWQALPEDVRGQEWAPSGRSGWGRPPLHRELQNREPVMVASYVDASVMGRRPLIYVEHGAGQSYGGDARGVGLASYSGGDGLGAVRLFIAPGEHVAERWRARYPSAAVAVVGCPRLDALHCDIRSRDSTGNVTPTVALTWHWPARVLPEMDTALRHYRPALADTKARLHEVGVELIGHSHPRAWPELERIYRSLGIEAVSDPDETLMRADLLVADTTSLMYEAASLGIPVLALNAPHYRRNVHHGLRWWSHVPGLQCDEPGDLTDMILLALSDPPEAQALRDRAVRYTYAHTDGHAAQRAADAIMEVFG